VTRGARGDELIVSVAGCTELMEEEDGIRLRARPRKSHDDNAANLFVRLAPSNARRLRDHAVRRRPSARMPNDDDDGSSPALRNHHHRRNDDDNGNHSGWSILGDTSASRWCRSGIEFLPLSIRRISIKRPPDVASSQTVVYVSYNGGDLADTTGE